MKLNNNFQLNRCDRKKELKLPREMSKELAEFIGIHFGDGCMHISNFTYRIYYSFNVRDKEYVFYVKNLFYSLFNANMKLEERISRNTISLYLHSKTLCTFFNTVLKIPFGPKKELSIPDYIRSNEEYLRNFLRGLFDTDGCITVQRMGKYSYRLIKICTTIESFAKEIKQSFNILGIDSYICWKTWKNNAAYDVTIRKRDSFNRFIELINPKNNKGKNGDAGI